MTTADEVDVVIIGAGPAGLVLAHLLRARGIDSLVLEARSRAYVERRVRAGVLESASVELLRRLGLADRLDREGMVHDGVELAFAGRRHRLDFVELTGRTITIYGQQEVVKDLITARSDAGDPIVFDALDVEIVDVEHALVRYVHDGRRREVRAGLVAGCDGSHGDSGHAVPGRVVMERTYPFAWLGILAEAPPTTKELIYAAHDRGFALYSMRSPSITRLYLQVPADERLEAWSDDRIWSELARRLPTEDGFELRTGRILDRGITSMRSSVATPMGHGRLLVAGDAAHIVPATGAKGMNLAIADAAVMAPIVEDVLRHGRTERLADYTPACLGRVWRAQRFSSWMTTMLHRLSDDPFQRQLQLAELELVTTSRAAATNLAEHYVGLPLEPVGR